MAAAQNQKQQTTPTKYPDMGHCSIVRIQHGCDFVNSVQHDAVGWRSSGQAGRESPVESTGTPFRH